LPDQTTSSDIGVLVVSRVTDGQTCIDGLFVDGTSIAQLPQSRQGPGYPAP
jgi:hypothetical protein